MIPLRGLGCLHPKQLRLILLAGPLRLILEQCQSILGALSQLGRVLQRQLQLGFGNRLLSEISGQPGGNLLFPCQILLQTQRLYGNLIGDQLAQFLLCLPACVLQHRFPHCLNVNRGGSRGDNLYHLRLLGGRGRGRLNHRRGNPQPLQKAAQADLLAPASGLCGLGRSLGDELIHVLGVEVLRHIGEIIGVQNAVDDLCGRDTVFVDDIVDAQENQAAEQLAICPVLVGQEDDPGQGILLPNLLHQVEDIHRALQGLTVQQDVGLRLLHGGKHIFPVSNISDGDDRAGSFVFQCFRDNIFHLFSLYSVHDFLCHIDWPGFKPAFPPFLAYFVSFFSYT